MDSLQVYDDAVELHLDIERVGLHARNEIIKLLQQMQFDLIAKIVDPATDINRERMERQLTESEILINRYMNDAETISNDTALASGQAAAAGTAETLTIAFGGQVAIKTIQTNVYLQALVSEALIQGTAQAEWWQKQQEDFVFRYKAAVRQGLVAGETNQQIIKRVMEAVDVTKRQAETLVRTSAQTVANVSREKVLLQNSEVQKGIYHSASLDRRTCPVCGARDGKVWDMDLKPVGHSLPYIRPPIHFRCRCTMVPKLKEPKELGINAAPIEFRRASMDGVTTERTFEGWLARKEAEQPGFADKTLGKGRAKMWRDGKITMDQMIDGAKPITTKQLKDKYDKPSA